MSTEHAGHTAKILPSGKSFVTSRVDGDTLSDAWSICEIYNPESSPDHFADNLFCPHNLFISEPTRSSSSQGKTQEGI